MNKWKKKWIKFFKGNNKSKVVEIFHILIWSWNTIWTHQFGKTERVEGKTMNDLRIFKFVRQFFFCPPQFIGSAVTNEFWSYCIGFSTMIFLNDHNSIKRKKMSDLQRIQSIY